MHLHILSVIYLPAQIFITFGVVADKYTDWIKYSLQGMTYPALVGGFSFGKCCTEQCAYYGLTSEIMSISGIVFFILISSWTIYALLGLFHTYCMNIEATLKNVKYFVMTLNLATLYAIIYSSTNSLYHFTLLDPNDTFN
jgi:hypothetical protein